jgi:SAM-dependent methyltransferase
MEQPTNAPPQQSQQAELPTSAAAERNKQPILEVLQALLLPAATVLEVASGTGQHAAHFAAAQPQWQWQPSDGDAAALPTIAQRCAHLPNVAVPLHLDLLAPRPGAPHGAPAPEAPDAPGAPAASAAAAAAATAASVATAAARAVPEGVVFDGVFAANLLHISPWPTCAALMRLAAAHLRKGGVLAVYGPFEVEGEPLAPSNRVFDADLRARDARWGLRRLGDVQAEAARAGLVFERRIAMPANNLTLVWRRPAGG